MTERFMFGEHPACLAMLRYTMSRLAEAGARVTVETETMTRHEFVLHTVCADMPVKANPVKFTHTTEERA